MCFPTLTRRTRLLPILEVFGRIFLQNLMEHTVSKATIVDPDQRLHHAATDIDLHCLPMSYKKDTRPVWVKVGQYICS